MTSARLRRGTTTPPFPLRLALAFALVAAASNTTAFAASTIGPDKEGVVTFVAPSKNIECTFIPAGGTSVYKPKRNEAELSCDRAEPTYVHLSIGARGPAVLVRDPGEQPCCGVEPVLGYGQSVRAGPFTCQSEQTGLTCRREDGAGFFVSRARADTF